MAKRFYSPEIMSVIGIAVDTFFMVWWTSTFVAIIVAWVFDVPVQWWLYLHVLLGALLARMIVRRWWNRWSRKESSALYRQLVRSIRRWPDGQLLGAPTPAVLTVYRRGARSVTRSAPDGFQGPGVDEDLGTALMYSYSPYPNTCEIRRSIMAIPLRVNRESNELEIWSIPQSETSHWRSFRRYAKGIRFAERHGLSTAEADEIRQLISELDNGRPMGNIHDDD